MTAYYNEIDPYAAQWLRNLIEAGHIAFGVVDWRGEELPPVGTDCEWKEKSGFEWTVAKVLFITEKSAVLRRPDGFEWQLLTKRVVFRPIRTVEQIAAEELRIIIESGLNGMKTLPQVISEILQAGYRKF